MKNKGGIAFLAAGLMIFSFSCGRKEKAEAQQSEETTRPVETAVPAETPPASPAQMLFTLDGSLKDWAGVEPFWNEGGMPGRGTGIDIRKVYFKNDSQYLYAFLELSPTIEERFKTSPTGDIIGDLFLDIDNNPGTGSAAQEGKDNEKYKGYEIRVHIPVGVWSSSGTSTPFVAYEVYTNEGGFYGINVADRQETISEGALIAHGPDGVELALRLDILKLTVPGACRAALSEYSHIFEEEGMGVGTLSLKAP